jgi:hypothetical protein
MNTDTPAINGYRKLTPDEVQHVNDLKEFGDEIGRLLDTVGTIPDVDKRALAIARTELQTGMMWLVRAITRPTGF